MNDAWKKRLRHIVLALLAVTTLLSVTFYMDAMFSGVVPALRRTIEGLSGAEREKLTSLSFMLARARVSPLGAFILFIANYGAVFLFLHLGLIVFATYFVPRVRILYQVIVMVLISALCIFLVEILARTFGGSIISVMS